MARSYNSKYSYRSSIFVAKSRYCKSITGNPLNTYSNKADAKLAADNASSAYNTKYIAYSCDKCNKWHLSPKARNTPNTPCSSCTGSNGKPKALYRSQTFAQTRSKIIREEQNIRVRTYRCPFNRGWHLTKTSNYMH